jgi:two-component system alkaline phosphatase synthesis response regulator PhoP
MASSTQSGNDSAQQQQQQSASVYDDGHLHVEHDNYYATCGGVSIRLPRTEFLMLSRLVRNPDRFVRAEDLWHCAWGDKKVFNPVSLHVYIYRLRAKLSVHGIQIETMVGVGYRLST